MANFQDKFCNALTYLGLAGVIIFGTASLWTSEPETSSEPTETQQGEMPEPEQTPTDTIKEVPMIETHDEPQRETADTIKTAQTDSTFLHVQPEDTTLHVDHAHGNMPTPKADTHSHENAGKLHGLKEKKEDKANKNIKEGKETKDTRTLPDETKHTETDFFE